MDSSSIHCASSWFPHRLERTLGAMDWNTRRHICELVAGIIASDRELHPAELKFMLKTFSAFGIASGNETEAVCPSVSTVEAMRAMRLLPQEVRHEAMDLLIASAVSDGKVT